MQLGLDMAVFKILDLAHDLIILTSVVVLVIYSVYWFITNKDLEE